MKRKPMPVANGPPVNVRPAYDQPPTPSDNDYLTDPDYPAPTFSNRLVKFKG